MSARDPLPESALGDTPSAELATQRTLAMLKGLFELMPVGISLMDMTSGRAVDVNDALCTMLGYSRAEMLSMDLSVLTPPALRAERAQMFERALDLGNCGTYETVLLHRSGRPVHVLRSGSRIVSPDGKPHVWSVAQDISPRKSLEDELLAAATLDKLTGLANRATLMRELDILCERARNVPDAGFAVLFLDFDRFKLVNDTLGHSAGDELLCNVAQRLETTVRGLNTGATGWLVARFGGDEFVVLAPGLVDAQAARQLGAQMRESLSRPYLVAGKEVHSSASIGVAFSRGPLSEAGLLVRDADAAMYEAKRRGRGSLVVFDEAVHSALTRAAQIEAALRGAHRRGEMWLVYQPVLDLETSRVVSTEALLRWRHPELGIVSPGEFIPIAEDSGDIVDIGAWVLGEACRQWVRWQREDPAHAPALVSVNLSRRQLALGAALLDVIDRVLAETQMPPHALELEVTEREVATADRDLREQLDALHARGLRLAMDDFGTGASSLAFLRAMPFDTVKIDKSFVTGLCTDRHLLAVAQATIQLVENLGMASLAEGVEEAAELATLQSLGCRYGQGWLFGRPMDPQALLATTQRMAGAST